MCILIFIVLEVLTAVNSKNAVLWDVISCGSLKNRRFGGTYRLYNQGDSGGLRTKLTVTNNRSNLLTLFLAHRFVTLMMEAMSFSKTSFLARAARCNTSEDGILRSHRRESHKSYIALTG
jgi:hypothetical protein